MRTRLVPIAVAALFALAGCGSEASHSSAPSDAVTTGSSPTATPTPMPSSTPAPLPSCKKIWVDGPQRLPDTYLGCREGTARVTSQIRCETGQVLYDYKDHYYAVAGGPVIHTRAPLGQDPRYRKAHRSCTG